MLGEFLVALKTFVLIIILIFTNIYETYEDKLYNNVNADSVLVRFLFSFIIFVSSILYVLLIKNRRSKSWLNRYLMFLGVIGLILFIEALIFFQG